MLRKTIIFSLLTLLVAGCIKEDLSSCDNSDGRVVGGASTTDSARVNLSYAYDESGQRTLADKMRVGRLYIFDGEGGWLLRTESITAEDLARGYAYISYLPVGWYTVVAWGYSGASAAADGYSDARADSTGGTWSYTIPAPQFGDNSRSNHRLLLLDSALAAGSRAEAAPRVKSFGNLFHAKVDSLRITSLDSGQLASLSFTQNTAVLDVRVREVQGASAAAVRATAPRAETGTSSVSVFAVGKNNAYTYDNRVDMQFSKSMLYEPYEQTSTDSTMEAKIRVQHLDLQLTDSIMLHLRNASGAELIPPINVIRMLGNVRDTRDDSYPYRTQAGIDRVGVFPIEVTLNSNGSVSISVNVNDWEILDVVPILQTVNN